MNVRANHNTNAMVKEKTFESLLKNWRCHHCGGIKWEDYQVTNEVWEAAINPLDQTTFEPLSKRDHLHFTCLEERIGRKLVREDFVDKPVNTALFFGMLVAHREPPPPMTFVLDDA